MKNLLVATLSFLFAFNALSQQKNYSFHKTIPVNDESGWDLLTVDEVNRNVYFSHATKVLVANADSDSIIAEIPNTLGVHGVAVCNKLNRGFISNGKTNSVTVFDLKTFKVIDTVAVTGKNPDDIRYDAFSNYVFVFNGRSNNATVVDAGSLKIVGTIELPGKPEFAASDEKGKVYINLEDKSQISEIDVKQLKVINTFSIAPGEEPSGLAIDKKNNLLFSVCGNKTLTVFDIKKEKVIATVEIGEGPDGVAFDESTQTIYSSNGEGNVTIIKQETPTSYKIIQTLVTQKGCRTIAEDEVTKKIYLPAATFDGNTRRIVNGSFKILVYKPEQN